MFLDKVSQEGKNKFWRNLQDTWEVKVYNLVTKHVVIKINKKLKATSQNKQKDITINNSE